MQIKKDTIYFINHETVEQFVEDVLSSGLSVRGDIRRKNSEFGEMIYKGKYYVPMSFQFDNSYVYYSTQNCKESLEEVMSIINEAKTDKCAQVYRRTMATDIELYIPKRILL